MSDPGWIQIWISGELVVDEPTDKTTLSPAHQQLTSRAARHGALFVVEIRDLDDQPLKYLSNAEDVTA